MNEQQLGTLIVTGGSRGIGAAVAALAGARGYAVAVNFGSGEVEAKQVAQGIVAGGGRAMAIHADVAQEDQIVKM
ncbi:MAG: SDR family NAD(P)-dependent oxidoreductase, partial [Acidobacteriaceae bacterium]